MSTSWSVVKKLPVPELNITAHEYHHPVGARLVHIECDDPNKFFSVGFRTAPMNDTGIAHILEHTVLCGSQNYPVRDPFFSMLKRSVNSFMNALTGSDGTYYPFSSTVDKDYYNLLSVYLDAVFFPSLTDLAFAQEGIRLEYEEDELQFKGVTISQASFDDNITYHYNSGGEPSSIITIKHQDLVDFHRSHYHPSNAVFVTYGDLDICSVLDFIHDNALSKFDFLEVDTAIPVQHPRSESRTVTEEFASSNEVNNSVVLKAWLCDDVSDSFARSALSVLERLLIGNDGSPLRKALIDSNLGQRLAPASGFSEDTRTTFFSVGLMGTNEECRKDIQELITSTLIQLSQEGFTNEHVLGVLNRLEFEMKEISSSSYPYPLTLMFRFLPLYVHTGSLDGLNALNGLLEVRKAFENNSNFFQELIKKYFLKQSHFIDLLLKPRASLKEEQENFFKQELRDIQKDLQQSEVERIKNSAIELKKHQESKEDLSCLPDLEVSDITPNQRFAEYQSIKIDGRNSDLKFFESPTNGISYFSIFVEASQISYDQLCLLPLYCQLLGLMDIKDLTFDDLAKELEAFTGGINFCVVPIPKTDKKFEICVEIRGKCLSRYISKMFDLVKKVLLTTDFSNSARLTQIIKQLYSKLDSNVSRCGHSYAAKSASASLSEISKVIEVTSGLTLVKNVKALLDLSSDQLLSLINDLQSLHNIILSSSCQSILVGEQSDMSVLIKHFSCFISDLFPGKSSGQQVSLDLRNDKSHHFWSVSTPVGYTARSCSIPDFTSPQVPILEVGSKIMQASFLHSEIREKGGAYGAYAKVDTYTNTFSFMSYRDPNPHQSLKVYNEAITWVSSGEFSNVKEGVFSVIRRLDVPSSPFDFARDEFEEVLSERSKDERQKYRERVLGISKEDIVSVAEALQSDRVGICYLGNKDFQTKVKATVGDVIWEDQEL
ncbi:hypothetical protein GEMRC1_006166 [Eukaryota sp. GEM-RC1]